MKSVAVALKRIWRKVVGLSLVVALSLVALLAVAVQPGSATPATTNTLNSEQNKTQSSEAIEYPELSYDELAAEAKDPQVVQKEYEKNVKIYRESGADETGLVEGVKTTLEKITGQDQ